MQNFKNEQKILNLEQKLFSKGYEGSHTIYEMDNKTLCCALYFKRYDNTFVILSDVGLSFDDGDKLLQHIFDKNFMSRLTLPFESRLSEIDKEKAGIIYDEVITTTMDCL